MTALSCTSACCQYRLFASLGRVDSGGVHKRVQCPWRQGTGWMTGACRLRPPHLVSWVGAPSGLYHPQDLSPPTPLSVQGCCPLTPPQPIPLSFPRPHPAKTTPPGVSAPGTQGPAGGGRSTGGASCVPSLQRPRAGPLVPAHPERSWGPSQTPSGCGFRQSPRVNRSGPGTQGCITPTPLPWGRLVRGRDGVQGGG